MTVVHATSLAAGASQASPRRVLFLMDPDLGHVTVHIRGLMFQKHFAAAGWHVEYINVREVPFAEIVAKAREYPAVYLLKVSFLRLVRELKAGAPHTKIIFDLTDALWQPAHRQCGWHNLEKILAEVDAIFSENEYICEYGRRFSKDVHSIPACTHVEKFDALRPLQPQRNDGQILLGWMGSNGTLTALYAIAPQLEALFEKHQQLHLRILGGADATLLPRFRNVRYSLLPAYDEDAMIRECLGFDIGLFPPPGDLEDYAVRGALKAMLYMTAGIPAVALNAGDCAHLIIDGQSGILINSPDEWFSKIDPLVTDEPLRRRIGASALSAIRQAHSLDAVFAALERALVSVLERP